MNMRSPYQTALVAMSLTCLSGIATADEFTDEDVQRWEKEFKTVVEQGEKLFHSALGSNAVSCDMCHPNGTNVHPETYPKFQQQLGKVATLRDMINWCIENPLEGKPLALDSDTMVAIEAYVTWERRGKPLSPGKH